MRPMFNGGPCMEKLSRRVRLPVRHSDVRLPDLRITPLAEEQMSPQEEIRKQLRDALKRREEDNGFVKGWTHDKAKEPV